jgi:hypothetical protein
MGDGAHNDAQEVELNHEADDREASAERGHTALDSQPDHNCTSDGLLTPSRMNWRPSVAAAF